LSKLTAYGVAVMAVAAATLLTLVITPVREDSPFLLFTVAVMASTAFGGFGPGTFATLLSGAGDTMNADALILQKFRGLYNTGRSKAHPQGLRLDFIQEPPVDDLISFHREEGVIRNEQNFHRFIARIPDKVMAFVPSPPPSDDPLLQRPKIDFDKLMVLVIISYRHSCFIDLDIVRIELASNAMKVLCQYSNPGPVVQSRPKIISYGAYCAIVTQRFDREVVFVPYPENPPR
jgi:hypothetical protein